MMGVYITNICSLITLESKKYGWNALLVNKKGEVCPSNNKRKTVKIVVEVRCLMVKR